MQRLMCFIAAVLIFVPAALATTVTAIKEDTNTLVDDQAYTFRVNVQGHIPPGTASGNWGVNAFSSTDYNFSLDYDT